MSFEILTRKMQVRPIVKWPGDMTPDGARRRSQFKAPFNKTLRLLDTELFNIGAEATVLQIAMDERDFRNDGLPRANARAQHPGIILGFNADGHADRLEFAADVFDHWEDNLRGIALGLEALRKVDRYGITSGSQQYAGFKALTVGDDGCYGLYSKTDAQDYLDRVYDGKLTTAIKLMHPDNGGDAQEFLRVMRAKELLEA